MPYRTEARLFKNTKGEVAGKDGTSGEAEAEIYQYIVDPYGLSSETISVKVAE